MTGPSLNLVAFQEPVFSTIQGEGLLVGMPSTFVRMHGCDYDCSWCDTKESWRPGSKFVTKSVNEVAEEVLKLGNRHIVLTGGNPVLQSDALLMLVELVRQRMLDAHITVETQGSVFKDILLAADVLSLSPKLHALNYQGLEDLYTCIIGPVAGFFHSFSRKIQFKIVVCEPEDVKRACVLLRQLLEHCVEAKGYSTDDVGLFLQPEFSMGRGWPARVGEILAEHRREGAFKGMDVRVLPQVHKFMKVL